MTSETRPHLLLLLAGILVLAVAVGWWWLVFREVMVAEYLTATQAATCLAGATDLCALAQALCKTDHWLGIRWYAPESFWGGATLFGTGLVLTSRRLAG